MKNVGLNVLSHGVFEGLCEVHGRIELRDFYYGSRYGWGDADTVKVNMKTSSIRFKANQNAEWKLYPKIFDGAYVNDKEYAVISRGKMDVRLQGIDAPELHMSFDSSRLDLNLTPEQQERLGRWEDIKFRQFYSARSTHELVEILKEHSRWDNNIRYVDGYVFSRVDNPNDLFDVYGRFVGDLVIKTAQGEININHRLVERGWALPDFYNTMTNEEIETLIQKGKIAKEGGKGFWNGFSNSLIAFDSSLTWDRNASDIDPAGDQGRFHIPKIFRRQISYEILKREGIDEYTSLKDFLTQGRDEYHITSEFVENHGRAHKYNLGKYLEENGKMNYKPGQVVFVEDSSPVLKDMNGDVISSWGHVPTS